MEVRRLAPAPLLALLVALGGCRGGLDSPSPTRRAAAVRALASEPGDAPVPALLVAQRDPSAIVRRAAAEALGERRGPHAAAALGAMLADPDSDVARAAAGGLARLGDLASARAALVEGYPLASPAGRVAIAEALTELGVSLRDAVEAEARRLWARNLAALAEGPAEARAGAAEELGASGRAEAVARLRELLDRPAEPHRVVVAATRALGEAGDAQARPLLEHALAQPDLEVAAAAAWALGRLGDPASTAPLARLAAAGTAELNRAALEALEALPAAPEVSQALCGVAVRSPSPALATRAARAAWMRNSDCPAAALAGRAGRGDPSALAAFVELHPDATVAAPVAARLAAMVSGDRTPGDVRRRAATALGLLNWEAAAPVLEARTRAVAARIGAARARWIPGGFPGTPPPLSAAEPARLAELRRRPEAIPPHTPGHVPAVPEWIDAASPADVEDLAPLLAAFGRLRAPAARAFLGAGAVDPVPAIRAGAVEGLGFLGGAAPAPELVQALADPSPPVRYAALRVLPRYGPSAVAALTAAVSPAERADPHWSQAVARALGESGSPEALPALVSLLDGPAAGEAASAIAAIGVAAGAEPLLAHLAKRDAPGRVETLDALAQLASRSAGPVIEGELLSERPDVRAAAVRAIGRLRYEPASGRLEALRVDYDGRVRRATIEALAKLPSGRPRAR